MRVGPESNDWGPSRGRTSREVAASQGMPGATRCWTSPEGSPPPRPGALGEERGPDPHLDLGLPASRTVRECISVVFRPSFFFFFF